MQKTVSKTMKTPQNLLFLIVLTVSAVVAFSTSSTNKTCKKIECPAYEVVHSDAERQFEIRKYKTVTWMSTMPMSGMSLMDAENGGFMRLFNYISGSNEKSQKIPMTAPVLTDITTAGGPLCNSTFVVSFYVPSNFSRSPPMPDKKLALSSTKWDSPRYAAVRSFGGFANDTNVGKEASKLQESLAGTEWADVSSQRSSEGGSNMFTVAQYNAPFEYRDRLNEIWFVFQKDSEKKQ